MLRQRSRDSSRSRDAPAQRFQALLSAPVAFQHLLDVRACSGNDLQKVVYLAGSAGHQLARNRSANRTLGFTLGGRIHLFRFCSIPNAAGDLPLEPLDLQKIRVSAQANTARYRYAGEVPNRAFHARARPTDRTPPRAREAPCGPKRSRSFSTARQSFAAKLRNSAKGYASQSACISL